MRRDLVLLSSTGAILIACGAVSLSAPVTIKPSLTITLTSHGVPGSTITSGSSALSLLEESNYWLAGSPAAATTN